MRLIWFDSTWVTRAFEAGPSGFDLSYARYLAIRIYLITPNETWGMKWMKVSFTSQTFELENVDISKFTPLLGKLNSKRKLKIWNILKLLTFQKKW